MKNWVVLLFVMISADVHAQEFYLLVGTYDSPKSEGIYVYRFKSSDAVTTLVSHIKTPNPSFLTVSTDQRYVYAVHETAPQSGQGGDIGSFAFNKQNGTLTFINKQASGGDHPCHVELDKTGKWLFASNYTSGTISTLPVLPDGSLGPASVIKHEGKGKHPQRQQGPHAHGAIMSADNRTLFVTDLGIDKVNIYSFDAVKGKLKPTEQGFVHTMPGSGPRLMTFHPNQKWAGVIEELSGTVSTYAWKEGRLQPAQRISTMRDGDSSYPGSADIHFSPDGKFLYASNRGEVNNIAIFSIGRHGRLKLVSHQSTLGKTPRNFSIDPTGNYLLCENQNSDEIVIFKRNKKTGLLTDTGNRIPIGKPVCIKWLTIK